jgi:hypothetical protein
LQKVFQNIIFWFSPDWKLAGVKAAVLLQQSFMERSCDTGYPQTMLRINYRNHPSVLDFFNPALYKGQLLPSPFGVAATPVGNASDTEFKELQ